LKSWQKHYKGISFLQFSHAHSEIWLIRLQTRSRPKKSIVRLKKMCLWSARASVPARVHQHFFSFNLFFSDAPCDPSMPSSEYTRYHRLQNVLASNNHHILYIESWKKSGIIYSIHIPFFLYLRIKFTTISLLFHVISRLEFH
jgi:hypothetical protein